MKAYGPTAGPRGLTDAMRAGWAAPTSVGQWRPLLVRIYRVLVSASWCGDGPTRFHLTGSDHAGIHRVDRALRRPLSGYLDALLGRSR